MPVGGAISISVVEGVPHRSYYWCGLAPLPPLSNERDHTETSGEGDSLDTQHGLAELEGGRVREEGHVSEDSGYDAKEESEGEGSPTAMDPLQTIRYTVSGQTREVPSSPSPSLSRVSSRPSSQCHTPTLCLSRSGSANALSPTLPGIHPFSPQQAPSPIKTERTENI
eukprot:g7817.t1